MAEKKYIIGIDLGTTNCTMSYAFARSNRAEIFPFDIPQMTAPSTEECKLALPSFLYFPLQEELDSGIASISWDKGRKHCIGAFASERGKEVPTRLIASAKSWLCHSGIDRREKILPFGQEDEHLEKMSPLEACSALLVHLKEVWDLKFKEDPFVQQQILITVPASFDPGARQLVQEASTKAGYPETILLEEPQAAFYSWLYDHADTWRKTLKVGDIVLVVDIGGGTTDFSLISVEDQAGDLSLRRMAVGAHLLLGGDNIDFAAASAAKQKLEEEGASLDEWQFLSLVHACRQAKEELLGEQPPELATITIMGRGSKLIGGSLKTTLRRDEIKKLVVDGFIPLIEPEERSAVEKRTGLQQVGLPYAQDPCISRQLAKFLSMTGETDQSSRNQFVMPTAVLFNGGTLKGEALRDRLVDLLNHWAKKLGKSSIKVLEDPNYDLAVSRGAVNYGLARSGQAIRIRSGIGQSYFIGVQEALPAVPGIEAPLKAICVVPFGMEEGAQEELERQEFALVLGEPATFRFFCRSTPELSNGEVPKIGMAIKNWKTELKELHPIETRMEKGADDGKIVRVKLRSKVTELGILELWCEAPDGRQWSLEFNTRS
jgi:molecular chaperone DnaK (HSP70)